jgi:sugar phosphate isomerase/epimerase
MTSPTRRELLAASAFAFAQRLRALPLADIKLGIVTDEIDDDVLTAAQFLQQYNLHWAEIRNIWGAYNTSQPMAKIREARQVLEGHGIQVSMESTGFFKIPLPPETPEGRKQLDEQWALLEKAMERARAFGTDKLRIFTFMLGPDGVKNSANYARIWELTHEAARRAKGFRLAVENIGGGYVSTGAEAALLLKNVKADNLGLTWDPNNAGESGEQSYPDGYRKLDKARIFHVHLRDYMHREGKVVWAKVGAGEFDNQGQIRALLKDGYSGTFSLETHWLDPKGKRYSTEQSIRALLEVVRQV